MFSIGDKVRVKGDHVDSHWVVMMIYYDLNKIGVMHSTKHGTIQRVVDPLDLTLVDSKEDWKQAIREVLLSEEFLAAFAKAFVNAPMPCTIQPAVISTEVNRSIAQEALEWFKSEDVFSNGESK